MKQTKSGSQSGLQAIDLGLASYEPAIHALPDDAQAPCPGRITRLLRRRRSQEGRLDLGIKFLLVAVLVLGVGVAITVWAVLRTQLAEERHQRVKEQCVVWGDHLTAHLRSIATSGHQVVSAAMRAFSNGTATDARSYWQKEQRRSLGEPINERTTLEQMISLLFQSLSGPALEEHGHPTDPLITSFLYCDLVRKADAARWQEVMGMPIWTFSSVVVNGLDENVTTRPQPQPQPHQVMFARKTITIAAIPGMVRQSRRCSDPR
eukprot:jgi/Mesvir1/11787/Mv25895-RA.2